MNDEEIDPINSPQNNLEKNTYENAINSANSDNSANVGVNSLANNTSSNNMEVQNEEEVADPLNEHSGHLPVRDVYSQSFQITLQLLRNITPIILQVEKFTIWPLEKTNTQCL